MSCLYGAGVCMTICFAFCVGVHSQTPYFGDTQTDIVHETGETAVLPCTLENLGTHLVVWTDKFFTLLTFQDRRIIDDSRISVERPNISSWNLRIRDLRSTDSGVYTCQVNTNPVILHNVSLSVLDPEFVDTPTTIVAGSGDTVTLPCTVKNAGGRTVIWRESSEPDLLTIGRISFTAGSRFDIQHTTREEGVESWDLRIHRVTVEDAGVYECTVIGEEGLLRRLIELQVAGL